MADDITDNLKLDALIEEAKTSGGSELANAQSFVGDLCDAFRLPRPALRREANPFNNYSFERASASSTQTAAARRATTDEGDLPIRHSVMMAG